MQVRFVYLLEIWSAGDQLWNGTNKSRDEGQKAKRGCDDV